MWLIGQEWKYSNVCSGLILIGRGLDLNRKGSGKLGKKSLCRENCCSVLRAQKCKLTRKSWRNAPLAQMVEQLTLNQWVLGSSPRWCTKDFWTPNPVCGKWPVGQAAKTTASHAVNGSSILPRVTNFSLTWHRKCAILIKVFSYGKRKEERKTKARSAGHFSFADFSFSAKRKVSRCFLWWGYTRSHSEHGS